MHALIANVEAAFCTGIPATLIKDTAAPLMEVQAAVLEDPKVGFSVFGLMFRCYLVRSDGTIVIYAPYSFKCVDVPLLLLNLALLFCLPLGGHHPLSQRGRDSTCSCSCSLYMQLFPFPHSLIPGPSLFATVVVCEFR